MNAEASPPPAPHSVSPESATRLCQQLVQIPSVNPEDNPGTTEVGEARCAQWIAAWIAARFETAEVRVSDVLPGRPNVVARFPSKRPDAPRILFAPHTDTVSVAGMIIPPFGGEIREGRVWGRGASDTKGSMASMLAALYACRGILGDLSHEIWFAGLAGEEAGQHGAHALSAQEKFDLVIAGEPTGLDFVHTHKGSMFLTLTTRGVAVHGASPHLGRNAIEPMAEIIGIIRNEICPWLAQFTHPVLGSSTLNVGTIHGGSKTNVVPDLCQMTLDLRTVPGQAEEFERALFEKLRQGGYPVEIEASKASPLYTALKHPLLEKLQSLGSRPVGAPWFCDAAVFAKNGSPGIAMGPGSIAQAHTRDEWIAVEDLEAGAAFFERFLRSLAA